MSGASKTRKLRFPTKAKMLALGYPAKDCKRDENGQWYYAPKQLWVGRIEYKPPVKVAGSPKTTSDPRWKRGRIPTEAASLVRRAKADDPEAARLVLVRFCEAVERGGAIPDPILGWLRKAFRTRLAQPHADLAEFLHLPKAPRGRPWPNSPQLKMRNRKIVRRVNMLLRSGAAEKAAKRTTADEVGVKLSTVEKVMTDFQKKFEETDFRKAFEKAVTTARAELNLRRFERKHARDLLSPAERKALEG